MNALTTTGFVFGCCLLAAPATHGETVTCVKIEGSLTAPGLSSDGRFVVGNTTSGGTYVFDTSTMIMTTLPPLGLTAVSVSHDGTVVLGDVPDPSGIGSNTAGIWTSSTDWYSIGQLPDALGCPSRSDGYDVSADGSVAVGLSWDGCSGRGFVWTEATGMLELEPLGNGGNRASVVSNDGSIIAGFAQGTFNRTPALWNAASTAGELLDASGDAQGEVSGMSDDGTTLLGTLWLGESYFEAVKWTSDGKAWTPERLGNGSVSPTMASAAKDMANDGTIVGYDYLSGGGQAWIQPGGKGDLTRLRDYITSHGGTVPSDLTLGFCLAISSGGRTIVGHDGGIFSRGWLVQITPDCPADVTGDGTVAVADLLEVLAQWGTGGSADVTGDGIVDVEDLLAVLSAWGPC